MYIIIGLKKELTMKYEELTKANIAAMKEKNKEKREAISSLIGAIKKVAIDEGTRDNITDELVDKMILKELKSYKEQIETCPPERTELLEEYKKREAYIKAFAPAMLDKEAIIKIINEKFAEVVASKNKGQIMKSVMPEFKGKADGKLINQIVEELCK